MFDLGGRLRFFPVQGTWEEGELVTRWRNSPEARDSFYNTDVVTPDTHIRFVKNRQPHDLVWMIHQKELMIAIGMVSLTVDIKGVTAEYGRLFIDQDYRGKGYAEEAEYMVMSYAFDILCLAYIWGTVFSANKAMIDLHRKTGFLIKGEDVPGHINPRGPVTMVHVYAESWRERRAAVAAKFGLTLPERQPKP